MQKTYSNVQATSPHDLHLVGVEKLLLLCDMRFVAAFDVLMIIQKERHDE